MDFTQLLQSQQEFFESGVTRKVSYRLGALNVLKEGIKRYEERFCEAMEADFHKSSFEVYLTEIGIILDEISFHQKHLRRWARDRRVPTPLVQFLAGSRICPEPYGSVLILSPWNYPIQLCLAPLIGAISAGNTAVIKPSAYAPHTSHVLAELIDELFEPRYIAVVEGGREENSALLEQPFDYIFFTGSVAVGKVVMEAAAKHLTPVTLELGGKSPVIVDHTADLKLAAKRIAFGKVLNAGQTCVAPDYVLLEQGMEQDFIRAYQAALEEFFPCGDLGDLPSIVNDKHFIRLQGLLEGQPVVLGGGIDGEHRKIEPTLLCPVSEDAPVMKEEIFGPILPILPFTDLEDAIRFIRERPRPLALYLFTTDKRVEEKVFSRCSFGGGCVNDTIVHLSTPHLPFGGVGASGMGQYHGKKSYDLFTHERSILKRSNKIDLPMRYHPYTEQKSSLIRRFLK